MADWQTVRYDPTYEEKLDEEIIPLCDALNAAGFVTTCSCAGHSGPWPTVWFEHSSDERIEAMARHVMRAENHDYPAHTTTFWRMIELDGGYSWKMVVVVENVFSETPDDEAARLLRDALDDVARLVQEWVAMPVGTLVEVPA